MDKPSKSSGNTVTLEAVVLAIGYLVYGWKNHGSYSEVQGSYWRLQA